jgi:hypothetical protein
MIFSDFGLMVVSRYLNWPFVRDTTTSPGIPIIIEPLFGVWVELVVKKVFSL